MIEDVDDRYFIGATVFNQLLYVPGAINERENILVINIKAL
jgi:hypothetical protein